MEVGFREPQRVPVRCLLNLIGPLDKGEQAPLSSMKTEARRTTVLVHRSHSKDVAEGAILLTQLPEASWRAAGAIRARSDSEGAPPSLGRVYGADILGPSRVSFCTQAPSSPSPDRLPTSSFPVSG